jgi:hypothetical protein
MDDDLTIPEILRRTDGAAEGLTAASDKAKVFLGNLDAETAKVSPENLGAEDEKRGDEHATTGAPNDLYRRAGDAWQHLKAAARQTWGEYLIIGEAMAAARTALMHVLRINNPQGPRYRKAWNSWLCDHGLDDMSKSTRSLLLKLINHRAEVDEMMAGWSDAERADRNSPSAVYRYWKQRAKRGKTNESPRKASTQPTRAQLAKTIEQLEAHITELEAARGTAPTVAIETELSFDVGDDGDVRLIDADGKADGDQFRTRVKAMFETSDRVSFVCERNGIIHTAGSFIRTGRPR